MPAVSEAPDNPSPGFWARLWCALRDHPYPLQTYGGHEAFEDWISGNDPFCPPRQCSHCRKVFWR
jgi:hypothetical protein